MIYMDINNRTLQQNMNEKLMTEFSFFDFRMLNDRIYEVVNRRCYTPAMMVSRIHRCATHLSKVCDKPDKHYLTSYYICMTFSWGCAFANSIMIDLDAEAGKRFPGVCPYCGTAPCSCNPKNRAKHRSKFAPVKHGSVERFQKTLARLYPKNKLNGSMIHLMQEAGELDEKWENFMSTHRQDIFDDAVEELMDVFANLCAVATCCDMDIAAEMQRHFGEGCCACHNTPCRCGYVVANSIPLSKLPPVHT